MWWGEVLVVALSALAGAGAGAGIRRLLGQLRRGVQLRAGPTEILAALVTGLGVGSAWGGPTLALVLLAGLLLVALSGVDIVHHRLPDAITLPALPIAAVAVGVTHLLAPGSGSLLVAVLCSAAGWVIFAALARISSAGMGGGDVKLIPTLCLLMGYQSAASVVVGLLIAFAGGSVVALTGLAVGRLKPKSAIPLGPYLLLGCWLVLLVPALSR